MKNRPGDGIMVSNQSLVLQDVTRARSGEYTCIASNQEGDGTSNTVFLNVKCELPRGIELARHERFHGCPTIGTS